MSIDSRLYSFAATDTSAWYGKKNITEQYEGPFNRMACPCDTCPLASACASSESDCKGFRIWSGRGWYEPNDTQRLIRKAA